MALTLQQQYDAEDNKENILKYAEKMWEALNDVEFDPYHPQFRYLEDPIKDKFISFATEVLTGSFGANKQLQEKQQ